MFRKRQIIETMYIMMTVIVAGIIAACTPRSVREAQHVVQQADSLWAEGKMYGIDAGDSVQLAQAYERLGKTSVFSIPYSDFPFAHHTSSPDTYSHACYHYGKLLRAKENPVEAMQAFISATHSRTRDYHILGRVYNNIGDICHLAADYQLSYDMFERSAEMYLINGDSLLYYYCINDMAFEMAQQGKKEEAIILLSLLETNCSNKYIFSKTLETRAVACLYSQQYDSAVYYAQRMIQEGNDEPTGYLVCAQAYSYAGIKDSSVCYAQHVLQVSHNLFHQNNALYVLTNDAPDNKDVRQIAADRADTQKLIEIRHGKLSQAVQLLSQDLTRKPNMGWLYAIMCTIIIVSIVFSILWKRRKTKMHAQFASIANQQASNMVESIKQHIDTTDIYTTLHWKNYAAMKKDVDLYMGSIVSKLEKRHLNEVEIRFCILTLLDYRSRTIAKIINYSYPSALKTLKKRTSDKLGTTPPNLKDFLLHILPQS